MLRKGNPVICYIHKKILEKCMDDFIFCVPKMVTCTLSVSKNWYF